jgi:hypothetical protein
MATSPLHDRDTPYGVQNQKSFRFVTALQWIILNAISRKPAGEREDGEDRTPADTNVASQIARNLSTEAS